MQPISNSSNGGSNIPNKCVETRSKCVIWDGPDIDCLGVQLCKGQSIEVIVYHTAKTLCEVLEKLNISPEVDLACITPGAPPNPTTPNQLFQLIIDRLCELNQDVINLQNTGSVDIYVPLPDCDEIIAGCPANVTTWYTDANGNVVTSLLLISADGQTSPAVEYLATLICDLLCRMTTAETQIQDLRDDVDNLINQIAGALPSVEVPACINGVTDPQPIVDPNDPTIGVIPDMATLLCDIKEALVNGDPVSTLTSYNLPSGVDCYTNFSTDTPLGVYPTIAPPPTTMADLGAIANPTTLQEIMTNVWVALCDLRNFAAIVKASCCPVWCDLITLDMAASTPPADGSRNTMRIMLNGTFTNSYGALITASSSVDPPGLGGGPPNTFDGTLPYTITVSDQSGGTVIFNEPDISVLFTLNNFFDATNLVPTLNATDDYDVTITGSIQAPDFSVCNITQTVTVPAVCDNQPLASVSVAFVGFDGVTLSYTLPPSPPWPAGSTTPLEFEIEIYEAPGTLIETGTVPYAIYTPAYLYIYSEDTNILPDPTVCSGGCDNYFSTDAIEPNKTYFVKVRILYNCGPSSAWVTTPNFTTFVPVEITLPASLASECVLGGTFQLLENTGTPVADISANFNDLIPFDSANDVVVTVYAKAGTSFGYELYTPYIVDTLVTTTECPTQAGTRCWGPPSLYKYNPLGGSAASYFQDLINYYPLEGCFDYINCTITAPPLLSYSGVTAFNNIDNTGAPSEKPGNAVAFLNNNPVVPGANLFTIPLTYDATVDPSPIPIQINPVLHPINSGSVPKLFISVVDSTAGSNLINQDLIYFPAASVVNNFSRPVGTPVTVSYSPLVQSWMNAATPGYTAGLPATSWTSIFTNVGVGTVTGVPAFMRISHYKWNGNNYVFVKSIYVTSDWLNAGLPNIGTTGFELSSFGLALRDKITIEHAAGVANNNVNLNYQSTGVPPAPTTSWDDKLTITQDPYSGTIGPFVACDVKSQVSYNQAYSGVAFIGSGCSLWGDVNAYPQKYYSTGGGGPVTNYPIEFVVTGDTTIRWEIEDNGILTC